MRSRRLKDACNRVQGCTDIEDSFKCQMPCNDVIKEFLSMGGKYKVVE